MLASLLTLILGLIITQLLHLFSKPRISTSITLDVVAFVLLVLIMRDQRKTAAIERGRIASMSGVVGLIWPAVIVLMVGNGG